MIFDVPRNDPLQQSATGYRPMVRLVHDGGNRRGGWSGCGHDGDGENGDSAPFAISRRYPMQLSAAGDGPVVHDGGTGRGRTAGSGPGHHGEGGDAGSVLCAKSRLYPMQLSAISYRTVVSMDHDDGTGRGRLARWGPGQDGDGENGGSALFAKSRSYPVQLSPTGRPCRHGRIRAG
jgi:hypothetical protein